MTSRPKRLALTGALALAMTAPAWSQSVKEFSPSGGSGTWNTAGNWTPSGVPDESHSVLIPGNTTCEVDISNAAADHIVIQAGGTLYIPPGKKLTLDRDDSTFDQQHIIDGTLWLDGGTLAFIETEQYVDGDGAVVGTTNGTIEIAAGQRLNNGLAATGKGIRGYLSIVGLVASGQTNGAFRNNGLVEATSHVVLTLASTTILADSSGAKWSSDGCRAVLVFQREEQGLVGDFYIANAGGLKFEATIKTCGTFFNNGGGYSFANSSSFKYAGFSSGLFGCTNQGSGSGTCLDPFVVNTDYACVVC